MNRFHGQKSVWPVIKRQINITKKSQQIFVATAYVGADAAKIMPLRRGDVLVCNASDAAIKQGSTSARALEKFFNRGVQIFNEPRLHGKVVIFPKRVFVGSANVSTRSRDVLYEAVIETTDPKTIGSSLKFVKRLAQGISRLDRDDLKRLLALPVPKPPPPPPVLRPILEIPKQVPLLKIVPSEFGDWSKAVEKEFEETRTAVRADFFNGGENALVEAHECDASWWSVIKPNMWYVGVTKSGQLSKPKKVIKLSKVTKRNAILWLAKPKNGKSTIVNHEWLRESGFNWEDNKPLVLKDEKTRALLKLFNDH